MSQKAICPRGHIWDPSMLGGLPPTEKPRCPICGEEEPLRARNAPARFGRWCRNNPALAGLSLLCLILCVAGSAAVIQARRQTRAALEAAEKTRFEAEQTAAKLRSHLRVAEVEDQGLRQKRQEEVEKARWRDMREEFQRQLREAEKARRDAVKQRNDQAKDRQLAEDLARTAEEVRQEALRRRAETARQLVQVYAAEGRRFMESGDLSASLLWYAEALRLAQKEKLPQETHRLRLAAVLAQCPRPVQLWMHDKQVKTVQLSADGKRVLTAASDGAVRVTETATGKRIGEPLAHEEAIAHAVFSPDGKRVLTATADQMVHEWDVDTGKELFAALQFAGPIAALSFSPDGKRFLVVAEKAPMGAAEVELHVHEDATGAAVREQSLGSELRPLAASFRPDGQSVLTICRDRCARVWDIATGKQLGSSFGHAAALVQASFSPDGERVLTASANGTARVWQTKTGAALTPLLKHGAAVSGACFSPTGRQVLTFDADRGVRVWDAETGETVGPSLRPTDTVRNAVFSPDGRYVLTTCDDGTARLWDYRGGEEIQPPLRHGEPIRFAAFTPAGDAVLTWSGQVVRLWDLTTAEPTAMGAASETSVPSELIVFSADGKRALRAAETVVRIYDVEKKEALVTLPHNTRVSAAAFSANGQRLLTLSHQPNGDEMEGHVRVWETATGRLIGAALVHPRSVLEASFSADGKRVLTACQDGKARLWDADTSRVMGEPMEHKGDLSRALFLPDGKHLLTVEAEGAMRLWDARTAEAVGPTWGHRKAVHHLAFSPDGQQLVTASADGTARVWEANTGHEIAATVVQSAPMMFAAFSPEGKRIVTVSDDHRAQVWDAGNGKPIGPSLRHRTAIALAAFSADGKRLATVAVDGVRVWEAASGEPIGPLVRHSQAQPAIRSLDFRADERPLDDLLHIAEVLSGQRMADAGATIALDGAALAKEWGDLRTKYAKEFTPSAERVAAWDRRGVVECEQRQLWIGVVRHVDRLLSAGPSADGYTQRARANRELHSWKAAQADYTKALAGAAGRWDLWAGRAEVEAALGRWDEALADYSKAIERKGDRLEFWKARGRIEAERGDWRKAAVDFGKAIQLGDEEVTTWCQHVLTLLAGGDEANYRRWCGRLVQRFASSKDETVRRNIVWTCALAENAVADWKPLLQQSERAVKTNPQSADPRRQLAALLYRAGQFDAALKQGQLAEELSDAKPQARDFLLMAMAAQRLGRAEEAKDAFNKAEQIQRERTKDDKETWEDRLIYQMLHREAETLMKGGKR